MKPGVAMQTLEAMPRKCPCFASSQNSSCAGSLQKAGPGPARACGVLPNPGLLGRSSAALGARQPARVSEHPIAGQREGQGWGLGPWPKGGSQSPC